MVRETDMPHTMQSHAMELAYKALDLHEVSDCRSIAHHIKQVSILFTLKIKFFTSFFIYMDTRMKQ